MSTHGPHLSRRRFLGAAASTAAVLAVAPVACAVDDSADAALDTAVIGGGIGGLYAAWRLGNGHEPADKIAVFEATDRLGGRIMSVNMPGTSGLSAEFGAMRFLDNQRIVASLVDELGFDTRHFPMGGGDNRVFLRGRHFTAADYARPDGVPYALVGDEAGLDPTTLQVKAIHDLVPDAETLGPEKWLTVKRQLTLDGRPLVDWGFWDFLERQLSSEAVKLVEDGGGYSSFIRNRNAAETLPWLLADFVGNPEYRTVVTGMSAIPDALADALHGMGTAVNLGHRLESLRTPKDPGGLHELVFATGDGQRTVKARRVILALPRRAIERIPDCPALKTPSVTALLSTVTPCSLAKAFVAHREPWWRQLGVASGPAVTDLPARKFYHFGTEPGRPPGFTGALTMAYLDDRETDFWSGLRYLEQPDAAGLTMLDPEGPFATELLSQIVAVHELAAPPPIESVGFIDWGDDQYLSGWHTWTQGAKTWEVMPAVRTPLPGTALHIVGEAWSLDQGWIEGALQTVEALLTEDLGLPSPDWIR
ncbi:flavin monoamine oxidase family protein [Mycolicibacterium sp.]|uniref:flavin monoamine oxidase family protein n=1 Tax=Mycolicibacterium sp. TaxID=2320850 RepID=UPI003D125CA9